MQPCVGTHFDSMVEAFEFYKLYSWEVGFGIRFDRSRRNSEQTKTIQDIVCICSVSVHHFLMLFMLVILPSTETVCIITTPHCQNNVASIDACRVKQRKVVKSLFDVVVQLSCGLHVQKMGVGMLKTM